MKRGKPLRRTPISRGSAPLRSSKPMSRSAKPIARTKRISPVSKKPRARARREARADVVKIVRARDHVCQAPRMYREAGVVDPLPRCWSILDVHEPLTRKRGGDATDPAACILICRGHHDHSHHVDQDLAHRAGILVHSWAGGCNGSTSVDGTSA